MPPDLAIVCTTVLPFDGAAACRHGCDVVISRGRIAAIAPGAATAATPRRLIDGRDLVVMPGLINAHTHSPETLAKGIDGGSTLAAWRRTVWPPLERLTERGIYVAALLGCIEMLRTGATAVLDHFRQTPITAEAIAAVARAYDDAGLRALIAIMLRDRGAPAGALPDRDAQLAVVDAALARPPTSGDRIRIALGPSAPTRCTDEFLRAVADRSQRRDLLVHMHVDETAADAADARALYGMSAVRHLAALDLVTPRLSIAHGVWLDPADMDLLAARGAAVVHNPVSNLRLGSGIAPVAELRRRGVHVAIGTDGAASNDGQNMFEAIKSALLLPRVRHGSSAEGGGWVSAEEALQMATVTAARILGFGEGGLRPGAVADLIGIRRSGYALTPLNDPVRQIALCGSGLDLRYTVVGGRVVLDDGRITGFDEAGILEEAHEIARHIYGSERHVAHVAE